jgi:hypothetical protein
MLFGAAGLLSCTCCSGGGLIVGPVLGMSQAPPEIDSAQYPSQPRVLFQQMNEQVAGYTMVMVLGVLVELVVAFLALVGGLGLLMMHRWARWVVLASAVLLLGWELLAVVYQIALVNPALETFRLNAGVYQIPAGYYGQPVGVQSLFRIAVFLMTLVFAAIVVPLLLLPGVGRAFAGAPAGAEPLTVHPTR